MAQATVKTVQYLDPRIEPQPDPVYDYVIGPTQNQYYRIPASGLSQSSITFNNLTTLGIDRAYLDTFEIELEATITFEVENYMSATASDNSGAAKDLYISEDGTGYASVAPGTARGKWRYTSGDIWPKPDSWTFESFPFNKCCDEARVNINGGAFFSQPMCYIRAKERYMNQYELGKSYQNVCPCHKALLQTESGRTYASTTQRLAGSIDHTYGNGDFFVPTRLPRGTGGLLQSQEGFECGYNNSIITLGTATQPHANEQPVSYWSRYKMVDVPNDTTKKQCVVTVTWREPLFVSPFSSKYDATYGRPLYNITSMDLAFTLQDLGNMIRVANLWGGGPADPKVTKYTVHIDSAQLCYQVMTIPPILNKPLTTLVPYRRFVPYITDYNQSGGGTNVTMIDEVGTVFKNDPIRITSGLYTFNEIPTAIWIFVAPNKARIQTNEEDKFGVYPEKTGNWNNDTENATVASAAGNWDSNKLFGYITHVNISMANTTQILNTAQPLDLYRIAKANGCEDSWWSWGGYNTINPHGVLDASTRTHGTKPITIPTVQYWGAGSVLRLKPGVDLIVPDQPLIPGANANNMVFQAEVTAQIPPHSSAQKQYSLWLLFEYVGVAAISPGQCEITMNPLGSGEIMAVSPVMSATSEATEGEVEGSGFWDGAKKRTSIASQKADDGAISMLLKRIPQSKGAAEWADKHGMNGPAIKRGRGGACTGGAVIGKGLNDWV